MVSVPWKFDFMLRTELIKHKISKLSHQPKIYLHTRKKKHKIFSRIIWSNFHNLFIIHFICLYAINYACHIWLMLPLWSSVKFPSFSFSLPCGSLSIHLTRFHIISSFSSPKKKYDSLLRPRQLWRKVSPRPVRKKRSKSPLRTFLSINSSWSVCLNVWASLARRM